MVSNRLEPTIPALRATQPVTLAGWGQRTRQCGWLALGAMIHGKQNNTQEENHGSNAEGACPQGGATHNIYTVTLLLS